MIIDTEKDEFQITISLDDAFNLLSGKGLSDKGWMHLAGVLGEWYHDTWLDRYVPPQPITEDKNNEVQKENLK